MLPVGKYTAPLLSVLHHGHPVYLLTQFYRFFFSLRDTRQAPKALPAALNQLTYTVFKTQFNQRNFFFLCCSGSVQCRVSVFTV